jgi:hypothetical protein
MLSLSVAAFPSLLVNPTPPQSNAAGAAMGRRAVMQGTAGLLASPLLTSPLAAKAFGGGVDGADIRGVNAAMPKGEKEVNKLLSNLGKPLIKGQNGFSPLAAYIGTANPANIDGQKVKDRSFSNTVRAGNAAARLLGCGPIDCSPFFISPSLFCQRPQLLVRFLYPSGWLVEVPSVSDNGEAGNIGANNYGKGDGANFAALPYKGGSIGSLEKDKEFWKTFLSSQMSKDVYAPRPRPSEHHPPLRRMNALSTPMLPAYRLPPRPLRLALSPTVGFGASRAPRSYEDVKIKKLRVVTQDDGQEMIKLDFAYTLLTRAGFTVERKGKASALVTNEAVVGLITATTALRYKELETQLDTMTDTFRAYNVKPPALDNLI